MLISIRVHAQSDQRFFFFFFFFFLGGGGGGFAVDWFEPHCEHRRCRSALGYLCSLMNAFLVGFLWLGLCLPRATKVQISFRVLLQSDQRHFCGLLRLGLCLL